MLEEGEPDGKRVVAEGHHVGQQHHVRRRLGHLAALKEHVLAVDPVPDNLMPGNRIRLRPFVLVMRETQVNATGMDVDPVTEEFQRHRRALGVPAGKPAAPGRGPRQLAADRGRLPEGPVSVEPLLLVHTAGEPVTRPQFV